MISKSAVYVWAGTLRSLLLSIYQFVMALFEECQECQGIQTALFTKTPAQGVVTP